MAIGTTPLFSKISGSAGPVDFRTRRNGKIEIGKKRIPANPQSTEQQNTRNAYGRLHELWQNAAWIDKTQYENIAAAYDISPWNAFLMRHLTPMRLNPVAYWPFVEGTGNTLHDFTTNENHGTISGASWEKQDLFNIPRLRFDGIDDYVNFGNPPVLNFTQKMSINISGNNNQDKWSYFLSKGYQSNNAFAFGYHITPKKWIAHRHSGITSNNAYYGDTLLNQNVTVGVTVNLNLPSDKWNFYQNGTYIVSNNWNLSVMSGVINLDLGGKSTGRYFNGTINNTMIFDYDLTAPQNANIHTQNQKFYEV